MTKTTTRPKPNSKGLNAYLDAFIMEAVHEWQEENHEPKSKSLKDASNYMLQVAKNERFYKDGNKQELFIGWALGVSLGTITIYTSEAVKLLHSFNYYAKPEQEAKAVEFLHLKLYMRLQRNIRVKNA